MSGSKLKSKAKGVDICAGPAINHDRNFYIIRSDLGFYMSASNVHTGENITISSLHPSCQSGDHYLCSKERFYIIKGNSCRSVTDLSNDSDSRVFALHPNCRGGDHYMCSGEYFYIIFQSRGVFRKTSDLNTYKNGAEEKLGPNLRNGLYYLGLDTGFIALLKQSGEWGVQVETVCLDPKYQSSDPMLYILLEAANRMVFTNTPLYSVHPDLLNFLPGGLAVTRGPAFGQWELIKTIDNDSANKINWEKKITRKVGYNKSSSSSMERNWKVSGTLTCGTEGLCKLMAKAEFSMSAEYGGLSVNTESQTWEEATEIEEKVAFTIKPKSRIYVWQYKLGFGKEDVLFCRDLKFTDDPKLPTVSPL